ncbi:hypothetical protein ACJX0J_009540, partial [Zea mays]
ALWYILHIIVMFCFFGASFSSSLGHDFKNECPPIMNLVIFPQVFFFLTENGLVFFRMNRLHYDVPVNLNLAVILV